MHVPVRLGGAELTLVEQLRALGASAEADRLTAAGLPTRRVESYHYTDLKQLLRSVPELASAADAVEHGFRLPDAFRIGIVNGAVQHAGWVPDGVNIGRTDGGVLSSRDDVITRLNTSLTKEALTLELHGEVESVLHIDRQSVGASGHAASGMHVFVGDGGRATIVETLTGSDAAHLANHATYLALGREAVVTHVVINLMPRAATSFTTSEYLLAEGSQLRTLVINAGAGLSRAQLFPRYAGANAHADITGLNLVADGQHADITMDAQHAVAHTTSKPLFKSIARGRSRAVVQGRLVVARDAQKTDAKLMAQGLMLSDEAEILTKPELEIYADDVVCGHGATCGRLDEDHLFYLTSRGIPQAEAETMLLRAFIAELFDPIENEALSSALNGIVDRWLLQG